MDQAVKEYAAAMERGWKKCPKMCRTSFYEGSPTSPEACCGNGHAALGKHNDAAMWYLFEETIEHIKVKRGFDTMELSTAIDILSIEGWTTPRIAAWIRSHLEDE